MVWLCLLWCVGLRSWLETYARTTCELLAAIEEIAIGGVHLMLTSTYIMFNHTIHHGIEVANPRKLNSTIDILLGAYIVIKHRLHHQIDGSQALLTINNDILQNIISLP